MLFIDFCPIVPSSQRPIKHLPNTKIVRIDFYNNYIIITINIGTFPRPHHLNGTMGRWDAGRTLPRQRRKVIYDGRKLRIRGIEILASLR